MNKSDILDLLDEIRSEIAANLVDRPVETDPPDPSDPEPDEPDEDPADPPPQGDDTFLWKPVSDTTRNLVVLTPASMQGVSADYNGQPAAGPRRNGRNGNRQHWRFGKPGGHFSPGAFRMKLQGGQIVSWHIQDPGRRYETRSGPDTTPTQPAPPEQPGGDSVRVYYDPPEMVLPAILSVRRVTMQPHRQSHLGRSVPVQDNIATVPAEFQGLPLLLAQIHTHQDEALYEMTFDPRVSWAYPFSVIYTKGWMQWTAAIPQDGYAPTPEQARNKQSTKWRFQG